MDILARHQCICLVGETGNSAAANTNCSSSRLRCGSDFLVAHTEVFMQFRIRRIPKFLGLQDLDPELFERIRILSATSKKL
jgi:hypothetical protein